MRAYPIVPKSYAELRRASRPGGGRSVGPEYYAAPLYDTQTYLDASSTELTFFGANQTNKTLGNLPQGGYLPEGQFFAIDHITVDMWPDAGWATTAAGGVTGIANDVGLLLYQGRPVWTLTLNQKPYGPYPLIQAGGSGGVAAFGYGTFTAEESIQFGANMVGCQHIGQTLIIPPSINWSITVQWAAAQDLTDDYRIRFGLQGVQYRPVA